MNRKNKTDKRFPIRNKRRSNNRQGATAVEFALVFPVAVLFIFGLLEISALYRVDGAMTSALIAGAREASIETARNEDIESEVTRVLNFNGIGAPEVTIAPAGISAATQQVDIAIRVESEAANGFLLRNFFLGNLEKEITLDRFLN